MGAQAVRLSNVDIDNALKNKDFEVLFQPIFDLGNGALARVETFVRWRHPSLGVLPPGAFISFFETQGRMSELTRYVLNQALVEYHAWRGASAPGFSINLALSDLADEAFASHFAVLLRDRGFPADLITLECPMPPVTVELDAATEYFKRLAGTGARLAIEVRGRANDFLRQVDPFPFDEIKTGGAAILRFARTVRGPGLSAISELLEIATKSNAAITAVGVEDQASLSALRGLGFAAAQGNHLGKVGPLSAFAPARVNEVRQLLGLEPLSSHDLHALFRTEAPAPQHAAEGTEQPAAHKKEDGDALVERLAARLARQAAAAPEAPAKQPATEKTPAAAPVGAQAAVTASAAKAAAIARAKRKIAAKEAAAPVAAPALEAVGAALMEPAAARSLQERLTREFSPFLAVRGAATPGGMSEQTGETADEFDFADETTQSQATGAAQPQGPAAPMNDPTTKRPSRKAAAGASDVAKTDAGKTDSSPKTPEAAATPAPQAAPTPAKVEAPVVAAQATAVQATAVQAAEAQVAQAQAPAAQAAETQATVASAEAPGEVRASLAVGKAHAFFRPGLRVAAIRRIPPLPAPASSTPAPVHAKPSAPQTPAAAVPQPAAQAPQAPVAQVPATQAPVLQAAATQQPAAEIEQPEIEAFDDEPSFIEAPEETQSVQLADEDVEPAAVEEPARRRKNFLTRKYQIWPTHFWPRSWKRAWQRRDAERLRRQAERDAAADAAVANE